MKRPKRYRMSGAPAASPTEENEIPRRPSLSCSVHLEAASSAARPCSRRPTIPERWSTVAVFVPPRRIMANGVGTSKRLGPRSAQAASSASAPRLVARTGNASLAGTRSAKTTTVHAAMDRFMGSLNRLQWQPHVQDVRHAGSLGALRPAEHCQTPLGVSLLGGTEVLPALRRGRRERRPVERGTSSGGPVSTGEGTAQR